MISKEEEDIKKEIESYNHSMVYPETSKIPYHSEMVKAKDDEKPRNEIKYNRLIYHLNSTGSTLITVCEVEKSIKFNDFSFKQWEELLNKVDWGLNTNLKFLNLLLGYFTEYLATDQIMILKEKIDKSGLVYNNYTYVPFLKYYRKIGDTKKLEELVDTIMKRPQRENIHSSIFVDIMDTLLYFDRMTSVMHLFEAKLRREPHNCALVFNKILRHLALVKHDKVQTLRVFYRYVDRLRTYPYSLLFPPFLHAVTGGDFGHISDLLSTLKKKRLILSESIYFNIIFHHLKSDKLYYNRELAKNIYDQYLRGQQRNIETYVKSIRAAVLLDDREEYKKLFEQMLVSNIYIDFFVYQLLIDHTLKIGDMEFLTRIAQVIIGKESKGLNVSVLIFYNHINGNHQVASMLEEGLIGCTPNIVSYVTNKLITFYLKVRRYDNALEWLGKKITKYGNRVNYRTILSFVAFHRGKKHHDDLVKFWSDQLVEDNVIANSHLEKYETFEINDCYKFLETYLIDFKPLTMLDHPRDQELGNAIKNKDVDEIMGMIEAYFKKGEWPPGVQMIKAYKLISTLDLEKYIYLINETPTEIRSVLFNPTAYLAILRKDFDLGILMLKNEVPLTYLTHHLFWNYLVLVLAEMKQFELATNVMYKLLYVKKKISVHQEFLSALYENGLQNEPIVGVLRNRLEKEDKVPHNIKNFDILSFLDMGRIEDAYNVFTQTSYRDTETIRLALHIYSEKYPIPPLSNLRAWTSLLELDTNQEDHNEKTRQFYEFFYQTLYRSGHTEIVKKYAEKVNNYEEMSQKEFLTVLKCYVDPYEKIQIFKKYPAPTLLIETIKDIQEANQIVQDPRIEERIQNSGFGGYISLKRDGIGYRGNFINQIDEGILDITVNGIKIEDNNQNDILKNIDLESSILYGDINEQDQTLSVKEIFKLLPGSPEIDNLNVNNNITYYKISPPIGINQLQYMVSELNSENPTNINRPLTKFIEHYRKRIPNILSSLLKNPVHDLVVSGILNDNGELEVSKIFFPQLFCPTILKKDKIVINCPSGQEATYSYDTGCQLFSGCIPKSSKKNICASLVVPHCFKGYHLIKVENQNSPCPSYKCIFDD
eukprot:gene6153-7663_t